MKTIFILAFLLIINSIFSQDQDYIITKTGEKIECNVKKLNHKNLLSISENGVKKKYKANELKEVYDQGNNYIVAKVPAGTYGVKVWCILKVLVEGDMNLALLSVNYSSRSEFNGTTTISQEQADVYYVFLEGAPVDSYQKMGMKWRKDLSELGSSCSEFKSKVKAEKWGAWDNINGEITDLVKFYNDDCN